MRTWPPLIEGWAKKGQFKADELKFSGIIPWLREQTGPVTKQQILDKLKEGQVQVRVVEKGDAEPLSQMFEPEENRVRLRYRNGGLHENCSRSSRI